MVLSFYFFFFKEKYPANYSRAYTHEPSQKIPINTILLSRIIVSSSHSGFCTEHL